MTLTAQPDPHRLCNRVGRLLEQHLLMSKGAVLWKFLEGRRPDTFLERGN